MQLAYDGTMPRTASSRSCLPCASEFLLEFVIGVEVVLDRALGVAGDEDELFGAGGQRLFGRVLDQRLVDDRQHLLRACLRRRQEARAAPGHRKYRRPDFRHARSFKSSLAQAGSGMILDRAATASMHGRLQADEAPVSAGRASPAVLQSPGLSSARGLAAGFGQSAAAARRLFEADVAAVLLEHLLPDAFDLEQVFGRAKRPVLLPVLDDGLRLRRPDAVEFLGQRRWRPPS